MDKGVTRGRQMPVPVRWVIFVSTETCTTSQENIKFFTLTISSMEGMVQPYVRFLSGITYTSTVKYGKLQLHFLVPNSKIT